MQMNEYSHTHNLSQQLGGQQPRTMMMNLGQQLGQQPMMSSLSQPQHPHPTGSQQQQQQQQPPPQQQQRLPQQQPTSVGAPPGSSSGSRPLQSISSLSRQPSLGPATSALPAQQTLQRQTSNPLSGVHPLNTINGQTIQQGQKWPGQDGSMSGVPSGALFSMGQAPSSMGGMHPGYHSSDMVNLLKGGYAHVATGMNAMPQMSNDGPRFDMANDFPSLGDVVGKSSSHHSQSSTSSQPAPSPTHNTQFAIQNEDFPSLQSTLSNPSSLLSPSNQAPQSSSLSTSDPSLDQNGDFPHLKDAMQRTGYQMQPQRRSGNQAPQQPQRPPGPNQGQGQVPNYATSAMPSQSLMSNGSNPPSSRNSSAGSSASSTGIPPSSASSILSSSTSTSAAASPMSSGISLPDGTRAPVIASSSSANTVGMDRYGLTGLLSVIRMTDPDLNTLALGTDLTTLGLNLNSTEVLYATFAYPCLDTPTRRDPDYVLPYCYYMQPPALKTSHLSKFQLETLFYIFYNMPKDTLQVYAAKELYNRDWRYHKEMKLWFTRANDPKANPPDMGNGLIYFDCTVWERAIFRDTHLLAGVKFMTEEELAGLL